MKKISILLLVLTIVLSIIGCGGKNISPTIQTPNENEKVEYQEIIQLSPNNISEVEQRNLFNYLFPVEKRCKTYRYRESSFPSVGGFVKSSYTIHDFVVCYDLIEKDKIKLIKKKAIAKRYDVFNRFIKAEKPIMNNDLKKEIIDIGNKITKFDKVITNYTDFLTNLKPQYDQYVKEIKEANSNPKVVINDPKGLLTPNIINFYKKNINIKVNVEPSALSLFKKIYYKYEIYKTDPTKLKEFIALSFSFPEQFSSKVIVALTDITPNDDLKYQGEYIFKVSKVSSSFLPSKYTVSNKHILADIEDRKLTIGARTKTAFVDIKEIAIYQGNDIKSISFDSLTLPPESQKVITNDIYYKFNLNHYIDVTDKNQIQNCGIAIRYKIDDKIYSFFDKNSCDIDTEIILKSKDS